MPIFQVRTPLSPCPVMEEAVRQDSVSGKPLEKLHKPASTPDLGHVHAAVASVESDGSCSPSRSFLPQPPLTPHGSILLSPCMTRDAHDDGAALSYTDEQLFDLAAASFFPLVGEGAQEDDNLTLHEDPLSGLPSVPFLNLMGGTCARRRSAPPPRKEQSLQTDPIPPEEVTDEDHFVDTDLQTASLIDLDFASDDRIVLVSSHIPSPVLKQVGRSDCMVKPPTQARPDHELRERLAGTPTPHINAFTPGKNHHGGETETSLASKSPRTDREDHSEASDDIALDQHLEAASPGGTCRVSEPESSGSGKKRQMKDHVAQSSGQAKRARMGNPNPANATDDASGQSTSPQDSGTDSTNSPPKDTTNTGLSQDKGAADQAVETEETSKSQAAKKSFCLLKVPKSMKPGTLFDMTWPEKVDGAYPVYTVMCPASFDQEEREAEESEGNKLVVVAPPHVRQNPPPLPPQFFGERASSRCDSPPHQRNPDGSVCLMNPQKDWKGQETKQIRVGVAYQVSKLPQLGSQAADLEKTDESDNNSYGMLWDPILAQKAEANGEDFDTFISSMRTAGVNQEECFQLLHRCDYSVQEAEDMISMGDPSIFSDFVLTELTEEEAALFDDLIIRYEKDFHRVSVDLEDVNVQSVVAHYYRFFRQGPRYKDLKKVLQEDNDVCKKCHDGGNLLLCEGCDMAFHLACLDPPLKEIPTGEFFCPDCELPTKPAAR